MTKELRTRYVKEENNSGDSPGPCDIPARRGTFTTTASSTCTPSSGPHATFLGLTTNITELGDCATILKSILKAPDSKCGDAAAPKDFDYRSW